MEDIAEKLGIRLRDLRNEAGISQEKFALQIGMDRTYYASVEKRKRNVSLKNLKKIADGFGNRPGQFGLDGGKIVQRSVGFHMSHPNPFHIGKCF